MPYIFKFRGLEIKIPKYSELSWGNIADKPTEYSPSSHNHNVADIIGASPSNHTHSYLPLSGGTVSGSVNVSEKSAYNWVRFNNSWVGFYGSHADAVNNTNRLAWMGPNGTSNFYIVNNQSNAIIHLQGGSNSVSYDGKSYSGMSAGTFYPKQAGVGLGYPATANRWTAVYASNGTIQTSDRNHKKNIEVLNDKYVQLFNKLKPVSFMFTRKGADRTHLGYIAQDVKEAMESVGLSELDFAGYCRDKESVFSDDTDTFIDVLDENGNPTYIYSLRYSEFIALNTHMIKSLMKRVDELEKEVELLKS